MLSINIHQTNQQPILTTTICHWSNALFQHQVMDLVKPFGDAEPQSDLVCLGGQTRLERTRRWFKQQHLWEMKKLIFLGEQFDFQNMRGQDHIEQTLKHMNLSHIPRWCRKMYCSWKKWHLFWISIAEELLGLFWWHLVRPELWRSRPDSWRVAVTSQLWVDEMFDLPTANHY